MEQDDAYENDLIEYEDGTTEARKGSVEIVTLADVGPLVVHAANAGAATDDDADLNFLDDGLSD